MPVAFTANPFEGPTTVGGDDEDSYGSFAGSKDSGRESRVSASEFDGDIGAEMPDKILFSESECRRQVAAYKNDSPSLTRVCAHKAGVCTHNHIGADRFDAGIYQTVAGRGNKFIDGIAGTCITEEEYEAELRSEAADRGHSIAEAGMPLATGVLGEEIEATESEESDYRKAQSINVKPTVAKAKVRLVTPPPRSKSPKSFAARFPTPSGKSKGVNLGAGMVKTAQSGLKPAPTAQGKTKKSVEVKPDPMVMAIQQLTAAFGNLDQQFKGMSHSLQELQVRADDHEAKVENQLDIF
jgi:hypothetical protein